MVLCKWEELPEFMRTEEIRHYYLLLSRRQPELVLKRIFDFTVSSVMLALFAPLFLCLAVMVKCDSKGPVFYTQERITQYGRRFCIYKFRTMVQSADKKGGLITVRGDRRITRIGRTLRRYRLDEIPQLMNIWKGEMTFVGTRPEAPEYVKHYKKEMFATLLLPAGVTSEASICYRDESRLLGAGGETDRMYIEQILPEKMKYNLRAIENFSFWKDTGIMLKTVAAVLAK